MKTLASALFALVLPLLATAAEDSKGEQHSAFHSALVMAAANPSVPLSMEIHCTDDKGIRSMRLYPGGVVIWNREKQARIGTGDRDALLQLLINAGFASFDDHYGGKGAGEKTDAPIIVLCSIDVAAGEAEKSSYQDANGERSEAFMSLAGKLLDRVEPVAAGGVTASSLDDGLARLANGELAAEAFSLRLLHMPADPARMGMIVTVASGRVSRHEYRPGVAVGEIQTSTLTPAYFGRLLEAIAAAGFSDLPAHLPARDTYQLSIGVLQHQHAVRARAGQWELTGDQARDADRLSKLAQSITGR